MTILAESNPLFPPLRIALIALTLLGCSVLLGTWRRLAGTTLTGTWYWTLASTLAIGVTESLLYHTPSTAAWFAPVRFAIVTTCFCPLMALLGAKRPQHRAWHFVVLALWAILVLPAAESLVLRHGQMPDVRGARSWFMLALIAVGLVNYLPTRCWLAGLVLAAAQACMLAEFLPMIRHFQDRGIALVGFAAWVTALIIMAVVARTRSPRREPLDAVWLDFRDSFGTLWALRVAERINAAAAVSDWPISLSWAGFRFDDAKCRGWAELPDNVRHDLRQTLDNLLRRFVSQDWIAARLDEPVNL